MKKSIIILSVLLLGSCGNNETTKVNGKPVKVVKKINTPPHCHIFKDTRGCLWIYLKASKYNRAGVDLEHHPTCDNPKHSKN